ncbi:MAG: LacI family DNA-binding transcriptional regulator [Pseudomonadota bacterium]
MTLKKPKIRTMEQLSATIGVSRPTLSKYFQDPETVSKSSRSRIRSALDTVDYVPNYFATNLNRKSTGLVGIVVPYLTDPFFAEIARTVETRCIEEGLAPTLFSAHGRVDQENEILDTLRSMNAKGVLLAPLGRISDRSRIERFAEDIPTVLFDSNIDDVGAAFVGSDNFQSVPSMVNYLAKDGEPPCFLEMKPVNPNANKRRAAYVKAMEEAGHEPQIIRIDGDGWDFERIGYEEGKKAIQAGSLPSNTVFCSNDRLAIGFISAAYELGHTVGREGATFRVAGHDDHPFSRFTCPALTTMAQDYDNISQHSVRILLDMIEDGGPKGPRKEMLFSGRLIERASA